MDKNSHFKVNKEQPPKLVGQVIKHLVITVILVPGCKELEPTTHSFVLYNHY